MNRRLLRCERSNATTPELVVRGKDQVRRLVVRALKGTDVFEEAESEALSRWLNERGDTPKVSAEVATVELVRACRHYDEAAVPTARDLLAGLDLIPLTADLVESAALAGPIELRSLDAIHLVSASKVAESMTAFVAYDVRLRSAASALGLPVASPA